MEIDTGNVINDVMNNETYTEETQNVKSIPKVRIEVTSWFTKDSPTIKVLVVAYHLYLKNDSNPNINSKISIDKDKIDKKLFILQNTRWIVEPRNIRLMRLATEQCGAHSGHADAKECECQNIFNKLQQTASLALSTADDINNPDQDIEEQVNIVGYTGERIDNCTVSVMRLSGSEITSKMAKRTMIRVIVPSTRTYALFRSQTINKFCGSYYPNAIYGNRLEGLSRNANIEICEYCAKNGEFVDLVRSSTTQEAQTIWNHYRIPFSPHRTNYHTHGYAFSGMSILE